MAAKLRSSVEYDLTHPFVDGSFSVHVRVPTISERAEFKIYLDKLSKIQMGIETEMSESDGEAFIEKALSHFGPPLGLDGVSSWQDLRVLNENAFAFLVTRVITDVCLGLNNLDVKRKN